MEVKENFSLKDFNTFGVDVKAKYFIEIKTTEQLKDVLQEYEDEKIFILGGGSNTLFLSDWDGLVLKIDIKGINIIKKEEDHIYVECYAGEIWDDFVEWAVYNNYSGVENMIMIPGTVGGAVAQNIAAYGQNIIDVLYEIEVFDIESKKLKKLKPEDCDFKYRSSKFKNEWKNKLIITKVVFKLCKELENLELSYHERAGRYGSLLEELKSFAKQPYSLRDVMQAVKNQREKRLPSVDDWGTCGSFFQNPVVSLKKFKELEKKISDLQSYPVEDLRYEKGKNPEEFVKIPAGRLLDELGWRGKCEKNVGVFEKHALCVVTNKKAKGKEVLDFTKKMKKDVLDNYGVELVEEVNIVF